MDSLENTLIFITRLDQTLKPIDQKGRKSFGFRVEEREVPTLVSGEIKDIDSYLFKVVKAEGEVDDDYVIVTGKERILELEGNNPEVFAVLYNATAIKIPAYSLFTRVCTVIDVVFSTFLWGGESDSVTGL